MKYSTIEQVETRLETVQAQFEAYSKELEELKAEAKRLAPERFEDNYTVTMTFHPRDEIRMTTTGTVSSKEVTSEDEADRIREAAKSRLGETLNTEKTDDELRERIRSKVADIEPPMTKAESAAITFMANELAEMRRMYDQLLKAANLLHSECNDNTKEALGIIAKHSEARRALEKKIEEIQQQYTKP